jgi:hypothetical protein
VILEHEQVRLLRSPDELPALSDGGEHPVVGIHVYMPDDHFSVGFVTVTGRCLRVRMPSDQLVALGKVLLELAAERRAAGDV